MRASLLVDVSPAESRETEGGRAGLLRRSDNPMTEFDLQDDLDEDEDDDDDEDQDDDDDDDDDEDEDVETWQVLGQPPAVLQNVA
jgi:hypothetical protein